MKQYTIPFILFFVFNILLSFIQMKAQIPVSVTGHTNVSPALSTSYPSLSAAVNALNTVTIQTGAVTLSLSAGSTESITTPLIFSLSGSLVHSITIVRSGTGANPKIIRTDAGTLSTSTIGGLGDAIIRLNGTDNIHFNGLDVQALQQGIEYGFMTFKPTATNACQQISIRNGAVTMVKGTSPYVTGIYISNGPSSVSSATGVTVSSTAGQTSQLTISGMQIENVHHGIYTRGNNSALSFRDQQFVIGSPGSSNGNSIRNYGGGSTSTSYGIFIRHANQVQIENNIVANADAGGIPAVSTLYGMYLDALSGNTLVDSNQLSLQLNQLSFAAHGIYNNAHSGSATFTNNSLSFNIHSNSTCSFINNTHSSSGNVLVHQNNLIAPCVKQGNGSFYAIFSGGSPSGTETISSNQLTGIAVSGSGAIEGIRVSTTNLHTAVISDNTIANVSGGSGPVTGIVIIATGSRTIQGNSIHHLQSAGDVCGIESNNGGLGLADIYRNRIRNLSSLSSTSTNTVQGILIDNTTSNVDTRIYNNLIGHLQAPFSTNVNAIRGIHANSTAGITTVELSYNTIYLDASSNGKDFGTSGIMAFGSSNYGSGTLLMRNNLVYNISGANGIGKTTAYRRSNSLASNINAASNSNIFVAGPPSSNHLLFSDGSTDIFALSMLHTFAATQLNGTEQQSRSGLIQFLSLDSNSSDYLKYLTTSPSLPESGAVAISAISTDLNGIVRYGQPGYVGTGSAPDIGAYELNGMALGNCSGITPVYTAEVSEFFPCSGSSFTVYINQALPNGYSCQWQQSTSGASSGFTNIPGANQWYHITSTLQATWYRCLVTCNISASSTYSTTTGISVQQLNGTYVINQLGTGDFISFAQAIDALNCRGVSGPVIFEVADGQVFTETTDLVFSYRDTFTVQFKKQGNGINPIIQRSNSQFIMQWLGARHLIFDGIDLVQTGSTSGDRVPRGIEITCADAVTGSQYNMFRNGQITMSNASTSQYGVYLHSNSFTTTQLSGTNSFNQFVNVRINNSFHGYHLVASSTDMQDIGNQIRATANGLSSIYAIGNPALSSLSYGIYAINQDNLLVEKTAISNLTNGSTVYGIMCYSDAVSNCIIRENEIYDVQGPSDVNGIYVYGNYGMTIEKNTIYALKSTGTTSNAVRGIYAYTPEMQLIRNNIVYEIRSRGTSTTTVSGIQVSENGIVTLANNMISRLFGGASTSSTGVNGVHINTASTAGTVKLYSNTIVLTDTSQNSSYNSACIYVGGSNAIVDLRNNILNNLTHLTIGNRVMALRKVSAVDNIAATSNHNILYAGVPDTKHLLYYDGTNSSLSINAYKSLPLISPGETMACAQEIIFQQPIWNGVMRLDSTLPQFVESRAQYIPGYDTDFELDVRDVITPDIGADEGAFTPANPDCATYFYPTTSDTTVCRFATTPLQWSSPPSGRLVTAGYDVYFGTDSSNLLLLGSTSSLFFTMPTLMASTTYFWKVIAKFAGGAATGCYTSWFRTTAAGIVSVQNDTRCGPGQVNVSVQAGGVVQWYASMQATIPFHTGPSYSTSLNTSATYYVSSSDGYRPSQITGMLSSTAAGSGAQSSSLTDFLACTVTNHCLLERVVVYPASTGNIILQLKTTGGVLVHTFTMPVGETQVNAGIEVPVNWMLAPGSYQLFKAAGSVNLFRNTSGAVYPYSLSGLLSITGSSNGGAFYNWAYNWRVRAICESPRIPVQAIISSEQGSTVNQYACQVYTWPVNGQTYTQSGTYVHTIQVAAGCVQRDSLNLWIAHPSNDTIPVTACGSYTWPGNGLVYTVNGFYTASLQNIGGCDSVVTIDLNIIQCPCQVTLQLYLQGYYLSGGAMQAALYNQGASLNPNDCDTLEIALHDVVTLSKVAVAKGVLNTQGEVNVSFLNVPGSFYIVIKHRHSIETWSSMPVSIPIGASTVMYNFSDQASKAYGNNQCSLSGGLFGMYAGDTDQNGNIDLVDYSITEADVDAYFFGYHHTDMNGDGNVDLLDLPIIEENVSAYIFAEHP